VSRGNERYRDSRADIDAFFPIISFGCNCRIKIAHDSVVTERCDYARTMRGCYPRQSTDIEMVIVAVRHQHDVNTRQITKCYARIIYPPWPIKREGDARLGWIE